MAGGRLAGKVALVTGAGRGFGRAIALAFAREGARVAANCLGSRAGAEEVVAEAALASEVGVHGITVNAIAPGGIDADMSREVMTPEYRARRLAELPLHRFGSVDDVAYCAVVSGGRVSG